MIPPQTGNMYIMLFAGHGNSPFVRTMDHFLNIVAETTAKTFAAALACLAIHQDVQQEAYEQIISVAGETADPV